MTELECDEHEFVGRIFDLALPVHLGKYDYCELQTIAPDRAYVADIERALSQLVERVRALSFVLKMLTVVDFPFETAAGAISRIDWLWAAFELMAVRLVSISDTALILTNEVLELGFEAKKATEVRVMPLVNDLAVRDALEKLSSSCNGLRAERNRTVHRGERRRLGTTDEKATLLKAVALMEVTGGPTAGHLQYGSGFDVRGEHEAIAVESEKSWKLRALCR